MKSHQQVLTINSGSSSIKFSLYKLGEKENLILIGEAEEIGSSNSLFRIQDNAGNLLLHQACELPDHSAALGMIFDQLPGETKNTLSVVGHRVVHGGSTHTRPALITPRLLSDLKHLIPFAPNHLPHEIKAIEAVTDNFPNLKQVACFDTAFHTHMPEVAKTFPLPEKFYKEGVYRYGFHGLSYEYICMELEKIDPGINRNKLIIAHLGNGASMAAVQNGMGIDTTMGFTPLGGLVMGTRSGDLDPGVILYCLKQKGMTVDQVAELLEFNAGLSGVSGISSDMKKLLDIRRSSPRSALAIDLFCYQARKFIAALAAALGGLDTLVFTGGIGERAAPVRWKICKKLDFIGIRLHPGHNETHAPVISKEDSPVTVRVMHTNEELMIARHTAKLIEQEKNC